MGIYNLKQNQELVYIVPRSWTSGAYFKKFREYLFNNCVITDIHLFESRDKVFDGESVLQVFFCCRFPYCLHLFFSFRHQLFQHNGFIAVRQQS